MTICMVIKCRKSEEESRGPVLLFASDTQESLGYLKRAVTKMRIIHGREPKKKDMDEWSILVASAGDSLIIDEVVSDIEDLLQNEISPDERKPSIRLKKLRKKIGDLAYFAYEKYRTRSSEPSDFEMLLGAADEQSTILYVNCLGKQQIRDEFGIIGSGQLTGGELLFNEFAKEDMTQKEAATLAALVVTKIGNVDQFVSGEPDIKWCRNRRVWHYDETKFTKIMVESEERWKLMKRVWSKMQKDANIETRIKRVLSGAA
ncbi:hypothetical protein MUP77_26070 [Candidatus Bathyarchaeota archaeon]|nr:hypothetical protein [Candidatus Bathyarchaeota archaeon]